MSDESSQPVVDKPKRSTRLKSLSDLSLPAADNGVSADEAREIALEKADRDAIDTIVLSNDVSKGGKIRVERKGPLDHTYQYICTIPADQWKTDESFDYLAKLYGGGDYQCRTFRSNGQMYKPFSFSIDYRIKGKLDEDEIRRLASEQQSGRQAAGSSSDMVKMFELLRSDKPADTGLKSSDMIRMMEMSSQKSDQMMQMMMLMMTESSKNMMQMMTAMISVQGNKGGIDPILLEMLKAKQEKTPMLEVLESMKMLKELTSDDKEEKEPKSTLEMILAAAGPVLGGMLGVPTPTAAPAAPAQISQPSTVPQPTQEMLNNFMVRMFLNKVLDAATKNADPALYADMISEMLNEDQMKMLTDLLTKADWAVQIFGTDPRVQASIAWLTELKTLLLTPQNVSEPQAEPSPTTAGGNGGSHTVQS